MSKREEQSYVNCPCGITLSREKVSRILQYGRTAKCSKCRQEVNIEQVVINPDPEAKRLTSKRKARKAVWYHATGTQNWHESVVSSQMLNGKTAYVHIGVQSAAMDRGISEFSLSKADFYLYEIVLDSDITIDPNLVVDDNAWSESPEDDDAYDFDMTRYLNHWESPGSMSAVVDPRKITVRSVRKVSVAEGLAVDSLYNMAY